MAIKIQVQCTGITVPGAGGPMVNPPAAGSTDTADKLNVSFASVQNDPVQTGVITLPVQSDFARSFDPGETYTLTIE